MPPYDLFENRKWLQKLISVLNNLKKGETVKDNLGPPGNGFRAIRACFGLNELWLQLNPWTITFVILAIKEWPVATQKVLFALTKGFTDHFPSKTCWHSHNKHWLTPRQLLCALVIRHILWWVVRIFSSFFVFYFTFEFLGYIWFGCQHVL